MQGIPRTHAVSPTGRVRAVGSDRPSPAAQPIIGLPAGHYHCGRCDKSCGASTPDAQRLSFWRAHIGCRALQITPSQEAPDA